jgi:hypothetical protein
VNIIAERYSVQGDVVGLNNLEKASLSFLDWLRDEARKTADTYARLHMPERARPSLETVNTLRARIKATMDKAVGAARCTGLGR